MKQVKHSWRVLLIGFLCASAAARAQQIETNRLTLSARIGFNISARFKGLSALPSPTATVRRTPNGGAYNYDDGYVLPDSSGNFGGQTWYWGYDDSSKQISGNNILLSRSGLVGGSPSVTLENEVGYGAELVYRRKLCAKGSISFGLELAGNYLNLSLSDGQSLPANVMRTTYPFPFTPGTTPPEATPAAPYQGSFEGPGFVIGDTPGTPTTTTVIGGATIQGHRQFDADIFGLRLGPYVEAPLGSHLKVSLSGGVAGGWVHGSASWHETANINGVPGATISGSGDADEMLWGFYFGATASWQFSQHWSVVAGAQYQELQNFNHSYGGRQVEVKLSESIFATLGISFNF